MTNVRYAPGEYRLRIEGHAGAGKPGEDLVCAAVTALAWTLIDALEQDDDFRAEIFLDQTAGIMDLRCDPDSDEAAEKCRYLLEIICGGLKLLEEHYPAHVRVTEEEDDGVY